MRALLLALLLLPVAVAAGEIKVEYTWIASTPNAITKSPIAGYFLYRSGQTAPISIQAHLTSHVVSYTTDANGCIRETGANMIAVDQAGARSESSNVVSFYICPPGKVTLQWGVTITLTPAAP